MLAEKSGDAGQYHYFSNTISYFAQRQDERSLAHALAVLSQNQNHFLRRGGLNIGGGTLHKLDEISVSRNRPLGLDRLIASVGLSSELQ
jgi:hypothetical protein